MKKKQHSQGWLVGCRAPLRSLLFVCAFSSTHAPHTDALFEILPRTNYRTDAPSRGQSRSLRSSRRSLEEIKSDEVSQPFPPAAVRPSGDVVVDVLLDQCRTWALLQQVRREQQLEEAAGREYKNKTPLTYGQTIQVSRSYPFSA
jgi:hypothetical protein